MKSANSGKVAAALAQVTAAMRSGDTAQAVSKATDALERGCEHPLFYSLRAFGHESRGRNAEALSDLERAAALSPDDARIRNALGISYLRQGETTKAIDAFAAAVARDATFSQAHFNKAIAHEEAGELLEALASHARAHETQPRAPAPLGRLATLSVRLGRWDDAERHARAALALDPGNGLATAALAGAELRRGERDAAEQRLRAFLARPASEASERAHAEGLLGDVLHAGGRHREAFAAHSACNAALRRIHGPRFARPDARSMTQYVTWLAGFFEQANAGAWREAASNSGGATEGHFRHVFIVGFPRSGTTLLENVLGCHEGAVTSDERDGFSQAVGEFLGSEEDIGRLSRLAPAERTHWREVYWGAMRRRGLEPAGELFVDKMPYNTLRLPLIAKLFPEARVVLMVRDPRDTVLSCFRQRFRMNPANFDLLTLEGAAALYAATMRLADACRPIMPSEMHLVRYETLVRDFDAQVKSVCAFAGIPWSESMRAFAERSRGRAIATPSANQLAEGLSDRGIGQWKNYADQMAPALQILAPWIARFGDDGARAI